MKRNLTRSGFKTISRYALASGSPRKPRASALRLMSFGMRSNNRTDDAESNARSSMKSMTEKQEANHHARSIACVANS